MTEQEYITVRDLSNVIHAEAMLRDICVQNQPLIDAREFANVMKLLAEWRQSLFDAVKVSDPSA